MGSEEAEQRQRVCAIARTWLLTPFRDQGKVKGPHGAVDCAMLLVATFQDAGLVDPHFDPRPYPPQWHLHRSDEKFLAIVGSFAKEVHRAPVPGDVIVWQVARCFSHGGIVVENGHVIHAYYKTGHVSLSSLNETELALLRNGRPRPFKLFDLWAK